MNKITAFLRDVKKYWNIPYKGRNVPFKEIAAYGVGGMGVHFATTLASVIVLSANNFLVGAAIGLKPTDLQTMYIIATIFSFGFTMVRSYLFDNTRSKKGKFIPWLKWTGIPTVLASILFVWMPYEKMEYTGKAITVMICYILIQVFSPFFSDAFTLLKQVLSPDSEERTDIFSITQIIFSFAPSVTNAIIPFLAQLTGGLEDIKTYRIIYPVFSIIGLFLSYFLLGTKERIVFSQKRQTTIRFTDAIRDISKNKYFWILNVAGWVGFTETAYSTILSWTFVYAMTDKQQYLGLVNTLIGNGALWAMMMAPFLIRRFGKRSLLIGCNVLNIILLTILYPFYENLGILIVICYLNNFIEVFNIIYNPGMNADMKDYQQYKTGIRLDGMFMTVGLIGTVIGFGTGYVIPALYEKLGLRGDYEVLRDAAIRNNIFEMLVIASIIGAIVNVIPFFFYDLTEDKHRGMVHVLKIRALFQDYGDGDMTDAQLLETMALIDRAKEINGSEKLPVPKQLVKDAKKLPKGTDEEKQRRKAAIKQAKEECHKVRDRNMDLVASVYVMEELNKFSTLRYQKQLERAVPLQAKGVGGLTRVDRDVMKNAKKLPSHTKEERLIRADAKALARAQLTALRLISKYYPDGLKEFDASRLEALENAGQVGSLAKVIANKLAVRKELKKQSIYNRCMKPYTDAVDLIKQAENYSHMEKLHARYEELLVSASVDNLVAN